MKLEEKRTKAPRRQKQKKGMTSQLKHAVEVHTVSEGISKILYYLNPIDIQRYTINIIYNKFINC